MYLGGKHIRPEDVENTLCRPRNIPSYEDFPVLHRKMVEIVLRCQVFFVTMVDEILEKKKNDEREAELEARTSVAKRAMERSVGFTELRTGLLNEYPD